MELLSARSVPAAHDFWAVVAESLTERQRTVVQLAYHAGYFESPRESTGPELADRLGITRQTLHHHLRRAQRAVFEWLFEAASPLESDQ
ncbi:helix-turn-helix domain-containing protein [Halorarius halobius]|uniref:helix-turn-helix domain-containing protein n=1 Tax=Halorarius halobius TaxID=2962671 RepID=UPI003313727D